MPVQPHNIFFIGDTVASANAYEPDVALIDLNALESDPDAEGWGIVPGSVTMIDPQDAFEDTSVGGFGTDGDLQAAVRYGRGFLTFRLFYSPTDAPTRTIGEAARELASALNAGGILVYQKKGDADPVFFDFDRSPSVALLHGQTMDLFVIGHLQTEFEGVPMRVICGNPHARAAQIELGPFAVDNSPDGRTIKIDNPGDLPSEIKVVVEPTAGSLISARYALRGHGSEVGIDEFRTIHAKAAALMTPKKDAAVEAVADSSGAGATAMVVDFATDETMERRLRDVRTPVAADALEGVHMLIARIKAQNGTALTSKHKLRASYGFSTADLTMQKLHGYAIDWRDINVPNFVDFTLGKIVIPPGAPRLVIDLFAERKQGDQELVIDQLILEPADTHRGIVGSPGFRQGSWARTPYDAVDLSGTGELKRDAYRLSDNGEIARIGPAGGQTLALGVHELEVDVSLREPTETEGTHAVLEVIRKPGGGGGDVVEASLPLRSKDGQLWTGLRRTVAFTVTQGQLTANDKWVRQVRQTRATANRRRTHVLEFVARLMEAFSSTQPLVIDPKQRRAFASDGAGTNDVPLFQAINENDPLMAPPGAQAWVFALGDRVSDAGYKDADEREPLARSVRDRTANVSVLLTPRRWGI